MAKDKGKKQEGTKESKESVQMLTKKVAIIIPWEIERQILAAAHAAPGEIAGWADAEIDRAKMTISLSRIGIPSQEVGGLHATVSAEQTHELFLKGELDPAKAIVSWHSHVDMEASLSSVDIEMCRTMSALMPVFVALVMNRENKWGGEVWAKTSFGAVRLSPDFQFAFAPEPESVVEVERLVKERIKRKAEKRYIHHRPDGGYETYDKVQQKMVEITKNDLTPEDEVIERSGHHGNMSLWSGNCKPDWEIKEVKYFRQYEKTWVCREKSCALAVDGKIMIGKGYDIRGYCNKHIETIRRILETESVKSLEDVHTVLVAMSSPIYGFVGD
jgi:proteasome lid subunit RPN8/RPN11